MICSDFVQVFKERLGKLGYGRIEDKSTGCQKVKPILEFCSKGKMTELSWHSPSIFIPLCFRINHFGKLHF